MINDDDFWESGISLRSARLLWDNGCQSRVLSVAKAFASEALKSGKADKWYGSGRKTIAELREWSGLNERERIDSAVELLQARGFTVIPAPEKRSWLVKFSCKFSGVAARKLEFLQHQGARVVDVVLEDAVRGTAYLDYFGNVTWTDKPKGE